MEKVAEDGKESTNSAHANGMNEFYRLCLGNNNTGSIVYKTITKF
jgi:hypothetical protein